DHHRTRSSTLTQKITRRTALTGTAATVTALGVSSCGIGGGSSESDPGSGAITGSIRFQTWNLKGEYEEYFTALIDAFTEENPGTEVEWIDPPRSEEHTSELQSRFDIVCRLLLA